MRGQIPEHLTKKMDNLNTQTEVEDWPWWGAGHNANIRGSKTGIP
jgi:hypothetical protein